MKLTSLIKKIGSSAFVVAALVFGSSASADPITQLIHFDDASNGWKWYSDVDNNFLFDPTNLQSSILCADSTNGGNGSCVIEGGQTNLPMMTRPEFGPTSQGSASSSPDASGADLPFTLDSFYFLLTGRGSHGGNYIDITGSNGITATFALGQTYTNVNNYGSGASAGPLDWNTGYVASFGNTFADVTSIQFTAYGSAQTRIDCIVTTFDGTTTQPLSSYNGGCGPTMQVPEPSTLALFGIGFVALGFARRRV